jgi:hypothetical protein
LTRGERKALELHRAIAARLSRDPSLLPRVRARLDWLRARNPSGARYYDQWARLLDGPVETLLEIVQSPSERACALRQESPFVDVVDQKERARIYRAVSEQVDRMSRP